MFLLFLVTLFLPVTGYLSGQDADNYAVRDTHYFNQSLFGSEELLKVKLSFDITYYKKKKPKEEYLDATLIYIDDNSDSVKKEIKVRSRGKFRNNYCTFPPLLLNFRVRDTTGSLFTGIDKIKMVPQCSQGMSEIVLREYTVYKLLNALTDFSLKARLIEVQYHDTNKDAKKTTNKKSKPITEYGFLIEPVDLFETRANVLRINLENYGQKHIEPEIMDRIAIFNYMIGNTDWAVPMQHNIQIYTNPDARSKDYLSAVAYDFDYNGIVDSEYAIPMEELKIDSFRQRVFQGLCRTDDEWLKSLEIFKEKEEELRNIISDSPYLSKASKKYMLSFIDDFYVLLKYKRSILSDFRDTCKEL